MSSSETAPAVTSGSGLFTWQSIAGLAGASLAVTTVCGALGNALDFNPKWLALLVAELIAFAAASKIRESDKLPLWVLLAFVNGCLIYGEAVGLNTLTSAHKTAPPTHAVSQQSLLSLGIAYPWWPPGDLSSAAAQLLPAASRATETGEETINELKNVRELVQNRQRQLEHEAETISHNIQVTEKELAHPSGEGPSLVANLAQLREQQAATEQRLNNLKALELTVVEQNGEASKLFANMAERLESSQIPLKSAVATLKEASPERRSWP